MPPSRKKLTSAPSTPKQVLTISQQKQQVLSKPQQDFNRLVLQIEKLQRELADTNRLLGEKLEYYGKHIYPVEQRILGLRKEIVKLLFPFYTAKKPFAKRDKQILKEILLQQLHNIYALEKGEPDKELEEVFETLAEVSYAEASDQGLEDMKNQMMEMLESFGFEMDIDDLDAPMTEEEIRKRILEMQELVQERTKRINSRNSARRKTKKQLEKEEREKQVTERKTKSLSRIYKQLAKVLHPDLELDLEKKAYKDLRMRELTTAYDNKDLHTLLRLELEWLQKEEHNLAQLTDEKLSIYSEVLKEQAVELNKEIYSLLEHPRYAPLHRFASVPTGIKWVNLPKEKKELENIIKSLEKNRVNLQGDQAVDEIKAIISYFRQI